MPEPANFSCAVFDAGGGFQRTISAACAAASAAAVSLLSHVPSDGSAAAPLTALRTLQQVECRHPLYSFKPRIDACSIEHDA